jgi:hypothetical protein
MAACRLAPAAEDHIVAIVEFIAADNEDAAIRVRSPLRYSGSCRLSSTGIADIARRVGPALDHYLHA